MVEYPIVIYDPKCWTVYLHTVPKEIRSSPDRDDYYDKYYVGITKRNVKSRWSGNGREYKTQIFGNAIAKYGWDNIQHQVITTGLTRFFACEFEKYLIKVLKSCVEDKHGYNKTRGGEGFLGIKRYGKDNSFYGKKHTEEAKEKMRKNHWDNRGEHNQFWGKQHTDETKALLSQKRKEYYRTHPDKIRHTPLSEEQKRIIGINHSKPVYVFDMELNLIGEYPSIRNAAAALKITERVARTIVNDVRKADYDYIIKYKSDIEDIKEFQNTYQLKTYSPKVHHCERIHAESRIYQFDNNYNLINEFYNKYEASEQTGISADKIDSCCNFGRKYVDGYVFEYKRNIDDIDKYQRIMVDIKNKKSLAVLQYDMNMNLIGEYQSLNDAKQQTGFTYRSIYKCCEYHSLSSNGYIWRYKGVDYE